MKVSLEKIGTAGTWLAAAASAAPCCLPLLASAGGALGLSFLAEYGTVLFYALQACVLLAAVGHGSAYRRHRNLFPLGLGWASAALLLYAYNLAPTDAPLIYSGLLGLLGSAAWSYLASRRLGCAPTLRLRSRLTCPHCGFQREETMPTDACLYFYDCPGCGQTLKPKPGDCCVFCSYGSVKCPPVQAGSCACGV